MSVTALSYDGQFALSLLADNNLPTCRFSQPAYGAALEGYISGRLETDR
jgi:hypothetical protein